MKFLLIVIIVTILLSLITIFYKVLPFRVAGSKKPFLAIFPKYRKSVKHNLTHKELAQRLSEFGFRKTSGSSSITKFTRGSIIGDISIKLAKVNVELRELSENELEIFVQAGWVVAFDTGDHWKFITELSEKIENE